MRYWFIILFLLCVDNAYAQMAKGIKEYHQGHYGKAQEYFQQSIDKKTDNAIAHYNLASALYKQGEFKQAASLFEKASEIFSREDRKFDSLYNLGNSFLKQVDNNIQGNIDQAIVNANQAIKSYEKAANINSQDADLMHNLDLAKKMLEELKKQKQNQQQKQDKQENKDQNKDQNKEQGNKDQQQDQQNKQQESRQDNQQDNAQENDQEKQQDQSQKEQGQEENVSQGQEKSPIDLTQQQAKMLIEDYERNDAPKGLLNFAPRKKQGQEVLKDW